MTSAGFSALRCRLARRLPTGTVEAIQQHLRAPQPLSHEDGSSSSMLGSGRRSVATAAVQQMAGWHKMTHSLEGLFLLTVDSKDLSSWPVEYVDD